MVIAASIYHKQLPTEAVDRLQEKHMAQTKPRGTSGRWWSFYSKKVRENLGWFFQELRMFIFDSRI